MGDAWRIAKAYWTSEEKWSAWSLLVAIVTLNLCNVYTSVRINEWNKNFYNALQAFNRGEVFRQLGIFCILGAFAVMISVYALYLNQTLQIRWRHWLTHKYVGGWLADRAYYRLRFGTTTDNPDQRIAEDVQQFATYVMNLSVGLLTSLVSLASFLVILWGLSGPADWPFGCGQIRLGEGRTLFVPPLPYLPLGTLASALLYPLGEESSFSTKRLAAVLEEVGLGALAGELDSVENWSQRLSQAEEQQLAFARILLAEPVLLFLDDATSALDDPSEARLYGLLRAASWRPTIVSASYKGILPKFHDEVLDICAFCPPRDHLNLARSKSDKGKL